MAREREMQDFIRSLFRGRPDLSVLTHSIVRQKYLAHVGLDHLEPEDKRKLKRLVEEELLKMQVEGDEEEEELLSGDQDRVKRPLSPASASRTSQVKKRRKPCINSETEHSSDDSGLDPQPESPPSSPRSLAGNGITTKDCCSSEKGVKEPEESLTPSRKMTTKEDEDLEEGSEEEEEEEEFRAIVRKKGVKEVLEEESESSSEEEACHKHKGRVGKKESTKPGKEEQKVNPRMKGARKAVQLTNSDQTDSEGGDGVIPQKKRPKPPEEMKEYSARKKVVGKSANEESSEDDEKKDLARKREPKPVAEENTRFKGSSRKKGMRKVVKDNSTSSDEEEESNEYCRDQKIRGGKPGGKQAKTARGGKKSLKQSESSEEERDKKGKGNSGKKGEKKAVEEESEDSSEAEKGRKKAPSEEESGTDDSNKSCSREKEVKNIENESETSEDEEERTGRTKKKEARKGRVPPSSTSSQDSSPEAKSGKGSRRGEDHPAVVRLKRYIRACGAHRNYKRLLGSCRSHQERLRVLKAELQDLGLEGNPSLEKCRAVKERREEAAEMASLDVSNIISSSGV
ncbi:HIRA-interacting protein 3 isoform X2 [Phascolarctos cinereus]|uniref:HIRA-interacting protein 3 isoform X2 n=1 Tax=Phascolarctos cinereus TaxID=38626 RepID=A0A6P5M284_PHACI|nr:HIRA-interacting protein 3 isoform X2 [Phascolarctos cinereus]